MQYNTIILLLLVVLLAMLFISLFYGSCHMRWWSTSTSTSVEGFADRPTLTPREEELFEDLSNNRLSESEIEQLVNSGVINDNLISKFLNQLDADTVRDKFEDATEQANKTANKISPPTSASAPAPGLKASFYMDPNYTGSMFRLAPGSYDNINKGPIGSVRTPSSLRVTLYDKPGFKGNSVVITENTSSMRNYKLENIVASIKVEMIEPKEATLPAQVSPPASIPVPPPKIEAVDEDEDEEDEDNEEEDDDEDEEPQQKPEPKPNSKIVTTPAKKVNSEQVARLVVEPFCGAWGADYASRL